MGNMSVNDVVSKDVGVIMCCYSTGNDKTREDECIHHDGATAWLADIIDETPKRHVEYRRRMCSSVGSESLTVIVTCILFRNHSIDHTCIACNSISQGDSTYERQPASSMHAAETPSRHGNVSLQKVMG